jgi:hypothetical protein
MKEANMSANLSSDAEAIVTAGLRAARDSGSQDIVERAIQDAVGSLSLECSIKERGQAPITHALVEIVQAYVRDRAKQAQAQ